jgi:hypothetical protein
MDTAINLVFGLAIIGVGSWQILVGLYVLELIDQRVPGDAFLHRLYSRWMTMSVESQGRLEILVGFGWAVLGVIFLATL